jgi:NADPH2:quinone reductase
MRAVVLSAFGGPERLEIQAVPKPVPGPGEVLIRIHAAGVNPVDAQNRADGTWAGLELPAVLGSDFSGVIEELGHGVTGWGIGDAVFGVSPFRDTRRGTYAEYHVTRPELMSLKPRSLDHVQAAAVPLAACTAYETVHERLAVRADEWLLIHGAAGGVGSFAVQLARSVGARVLAVASSRHHNLLGDLGADVCIDYESEDVAGAVRSHARGPVDAVADFVGTGTLSRSLPLLREHGRAATIVSFDGDFDLAIDLNITLHGVLLEPANPSALQVIAAQAARGLIRPVVSQVLSLEQASDAHRMLEAGHMQGKVVLCVR